MGVEGQLLVLRHGESSWNAAHRFTGWADPPLTRRGRAEASIAGRALLETGTVPDVVFTSVLRRAVDTAAAVVAELDQTPVTRSVWWLNERHYGLLQGLGHEAARRRYGRVQVAKWRRNWSDMPPPMPRDDPRHPTHDERYADVDPTLLPDTESLAVCLARQLPGLHEIVELVEAGASVLIVGHGNSLRSLIAHLEALPAAQVPRLLVPTGVPIAYRYRGRWYREQVDFGVSGTWAGP